MWWFAHLLSWSSLNQGCGSGSMHGMCAAISTSPVVFYFQWQPYYPKPFFVVSRTLILLIFLTPTSRIVKRLKQSSHQMEHSDLPLAISVSRANWRWFSITALTSYNRWIAVTLSIWQAIIRGTLCFKWIIAWFTLPAWAVLGGFFLQAWA